MLGFPTLQGPPGDILLGIAFRYDRQNSIDQFRSRQTATQLSDSVPDRLVLYKADAGIRLCRAGLVVLSTFGNPEIDHVD